MLVLYIRSRMPICNHNFPHLSPHDVAVVIPLEGPPFVNRCEVAHQFGLVVVKDITTAWHEAFVEAALLVVSIVTPLVLSGRHPPKAVMAPELITVGEKLEMSKL